MARPGSVDRVLAALDEKARFWEARARSMRALLARMRRELRAAERGPRAGGRGEKAAPNRRRGGVGAAAARLLEEWGRAARVAEILPELVKRGVKIGGRRPGQTLASTLIRYPGVRRVGRGTYAAQPSKKPRAPRGR